MSTIYLEIPSVDEQHPVSTRIVPAQPTPVTHQIMFSAEEFDQLHHDDAMASAVIVIILSCAFLVLTCLVIGANVWTTFFAG